LLKVKGKEGEVSLPNALFIPWNAEHIPLGRFSLFQAFFLS
jgi:hypothetical protein